MREIGDGRLFLIRRVRPVGPVWEDHRSYRYFHDLRDRAFPVHLLPLPVLTVFCLDDRLVEKVREIIDVNIGVQNHVAAAAAVSTIGSTFRHKFLAAKANATAPAISRLGENFNPIDKHGER
jgi:hypothetical protein